VGKSVACLKGTILYIDGRPWAYDVSADEATEIILDMADQPNAPNHVEFDLTEPKTLKQLYAA
jgi:hypothetical protein